MSDSDSTPRLQRIEAILRREFKPEHLEVIDESERHRGHAGAASGGGHFQVSIVSADFDGRSRIERHRMLFQALADLMPAEIHALSVEARTPAEWKAER